MRMLMIPFVVVGLLFMFGLASHVYSAEQPMLQDFDLNACYSKCPCPWGAVQVCFDCKQACDRKQWKELDKMMEGKSAKSQEED